jgi:NAD(P)-dependent dehydrogenase (short-subunit alcohol dehydrogenase family)
MGLPRTKLADRSFDTRPPISYTSTMLRIAVIDGQGGGIGNLIVKRLREEFGDTVEIIALGTNAAATTSMMKSRANKGATGENAIVWNSERVDVIVGPLSVALPDAMLGEVTAKMASAVVSSKARTILLPLNQEEIEIAGVNKEPLPHLIEHMIARIKETGHV